MHAQQPLLVQRFDVVGSGIASLRSLILALAVRGKLVPQNPHDEPAETLLGRAKDVRARKVQSGALRQAAVVSAVAEEEKPHALPSGWTWARIGDLGQVVGGGTPKSDEPENWAESGTPWLTPADLYGHRALTISRGRRDISARGLASSSARLLPVGSVLFSSRAPIGYVAIAGAELATNQGFKSCVPFVEGLSPYLYWYLKHSAPAIDESASGTTFKEISGAEFASVVVPLPPLAEQARIVARIDELMRLCDALEEKGRLEAEQHARLLSTLLGTLTDSATPAELAANWQRVAEHFDLLLDRPEAVDTLEQTVLQLAIRGLLVSHVQADDPAISKPGPATNASGDSLSDSDSVPFELPRSWKWQRLGDIAIVERGGSPRPIQAFLTDDPLGLNWIKIGDTDKGGKYITNAAERIRPEGLSKTRRVFPGDFLLTNSMSFGRPYITLIEGCIHDGWLRIRPPESLNKDYLYFLLSSPFTRERFVQAAAGGVVQNLNADKVRDLCIPVPPTAEQERIASAITHLFSLCATLREHLQAQQATQSRLAEALVEQALSA